MVGDRFKLTLGQLGLTTGWLAENGGARAALNDGGSVGEDGAKGCQSGVSSLTKRGYMFGYATDHTGNRVTTT